jgi:superfamily I DNA/RNA helicase
VFYVAITRAKKRLVLTRAVWNGRERVYASPYVEKIPNEYLWKNGRWDGGID